MRKLNVMTLFHFITLVIVSSSIILWCISSYGNFYVVNDVAAAHSSMKVLKLDIEDACEAACARKKTCVMYQYAGSECSLYNTTLEQAGLGALDVSGSTLALKKIVKSSKHESDGQLYYVSDLVSTSANCTRCRDICGGHFHVANLPRSSPVLKQIVQRGDALNHPLLYEVGGFVPFCWNSDNGQNCKHGILVSRALDAARLRVYHRGKDLSYVKRKFVKVLCQSNPLGRKKISKIKIVYELKDMCKGWFNSIVCSCPMFWMMATEVNELWFELKNELSEVLGDWYSSVEDYFREVYLEIIAWMEAEE
ncbi:PAN/Apple domain [Trinorchestia longiramus]|nr:PAN/Apple domain [Trinorchestia longiramus]